MAVTPRFHWQNLFQASGTTIAASSQDSAHPVRWLRDQLRSMTWRSKLGWTVVAGFNDKIDFNNGTNRTATIAPGTYTTGSDLAAAIQTAMAAAYGTGTWTVTYSGSTFKFTITHSATAFILQWASGANTATGAHKDLGWAVTNTGSATTQTSTTAVYHSRAYVTFDLGSAQTLTVGEVINHNAGTGGTFTLRGSATSTALALTAPSTTQTLVGDSAIRILHFAGQSFRYWALLIEDQANPDGFSEAGVVFGGPYLELGRGPAPGLEKGRTELSGVVKADQGAHFVDEKATGRSRRVAWVLLTDADATLVETMVEDRKIGKNFFFCLDPVSNPAKTLYACFASAVDLQHDPAQTLRWKFGATIEEALE